LIIKKEANALSQTGAELAGNITRTTVSINQMTANIQSIRSRTEDQSQGVKSTSSIMGQVVNNKKQIYALISEVSRFKVE
jgi:methyl-accepting chemotaxis protein